MDPYLYPGTNVLRNVPGIQDAALLDRFEATATAFRLFQLTERPVAGKFDRVHLYRIHFHIFQDVYPWAGEVRTVEISKADSLFALTPHIVSSLDHSLGNLANERHLRGLAPEHFCRRAAFYLGELNAIHPFREGNGRAQREFLRHLAVHNQFDLDWTPISRERMIEASRDSFRGSNAGFEAILREAIVTPSQKFY